MSTDTNITLVARRNDILEITARAIIDQADALPDLTGIVVLLPDLQFAPRLRLHLLQQAESRGFPALLGPAISTLDHWLAETWPLSVQVPGRARRELMLVEVLQQHPDVFSGSNPWQVAASLVSLFDELTVNRVSVPDDVGAFTEQLCSAYGISDRLPEPLGMEATVVHRLWMAWHAQLDAMHMLDPGVAYLEKLAMCRNDSNRHAVIISGFDRLSETETDWISTMLDAGKAHCILYQQDAGDAAPVSKLLPQAPPADTPAAACLDAVFQSRAAPMPERARGLADTLPESPLAEWLTVFTASSPEQEARAIDLQVRQWLLDERNPYYEKLFENALCAKA